VKIDSSGKSLGRLASGARNGAVARPDATTEPAAAGPQVELSPLSTRLQEIGSTLANTPAVNSQRVAEIRQAIAEGNLKIDSSKIADGLIASVRQMLAAKK
jgi:negative regulator of flagellin synthesis FlgM